MRFTRVLGSAITILMLLLRPSPTWAQADHTDVVRQAVADLSAAHVDMSGACGAVKILDLVAFRLRPQYALLHKAGGSRAVLKADGSCLTGDQTSDPEGFATDYLIDKSTGFGYDILGDGGGANSPQFDGPETDPGLVARNQQNMREPFDPSTFFTPAIPLPTSPVSVSPVNEVQNVPLDQPTLTWAASGATSYDVYFDTVNPPALLTAGVTGTSAPIATPLKQGTIYFWRIAAKNASGTTLGSVWSFATTIPPPVVTPPVVTPPDAPPVIVQPGAKLTWKQILLFIIALPAVIAFCASGACR
jgi:hypothetical protein